MTRHRFNGESHERFLEAIRPGRQTADSLDVPLRDWIPTHQFRDRLPVVRRVEVFPRPQPGGTTGGADDGTVILRAGRRGICPECAGCLGDSHRIRIAPGSMAAFHPPAALLTVDRYDHAALAVPAGGFYEIPFRSDLRGPIYHQKPGAHQRCSGDWRHCARGWIGGRTWN